MPASGVLIHPVAGIDCNMKTACIALHVLTKTSAQVEEQRVSGGVNLEYFHAPIGSLYQGLGNVMLRLEPTGQRAAGNTTVLLNAHYDSTLGSPGTLTMTLQSL